MKYISIIFFSLFLVSNVSADIRKDILEDGKVIAFSNFDKTTTQLITIYKGIFYTCYVDEELVHCMDNIESTDKHRDILKDGKVIAFSSYNEDNEGNSAFITKVVTLYDNNIYNCIFNFQSSLDCFLLN